MANVPRRTTALASDGRKQFLSELKNEFLNSPLATNGVLGLILVGLEKAVEMGFACPCNPAWNALFVSAYFILPGVAAATLMLVIKGVRFSECNCQQLVNFLLFGLIPLLTWLILMLFNGQYYACAMTTWSGRFVIIDKAEPQRWCESDNSTLFMERMIQTQQWYFESQAFGLGHLLGCGLLFGVYICLHKKNRAEEAKDEEEEPDISNTLQTCNL